MTALFFGSLFLVLYPFVLYPLLLAMTALFYRKRERPLLSNPPFSVSLLVVVRDGERLIEDKIRNCLNLDYPKDRLEIVVASDGSADGTVSRAAAWTKRGIRLYDYPERDGKIAAINKTTPVCAGEILVFSDADAQLAEDALKKIVSWFADPSIGGVCGRKIVRSDRDGFGASQSRYVSYEDFVRSRESTVSSVASNEGKLYAMRRELFKPIPGGVMDDIMNAMNVIAQKRRFIFDPDAKAFIAPPSLDPAHEVERRRRIVNPSLLGMFLMRRLFNPLQYGSYSFILFSHKVLRRFSPFFIVTLLIASGGLFFRHPFFSAIFFLQAIVYLHGLAHHRGIAPRLTAFPRVAKILSASYYFCLGNWGTLLGVLDFLRGKQVTQWQPRKPESLQDEQPI